MNSLQCANLRLADPVYGCVIWTRFCRLVAWLFFFAVLALLWPLGTLRYEYERNKDFRDANHCLIIWMHGLITMAFRDSLGVEVWLEGGSLVAWFRHGDRLLSGDYDGDIGMHDRDCEKLLSKGEGALKQALERYPLTAQCGETYGDANVWLQTSGKEISMCPKNQASEEPPSCTGIQPWRRAIVWCRWRKLDGTNGVVHIDIFRYGDAACAELSPLWRDRFDRDADGRYRGWMIRQSGSCDKIQQNPYPASWVYPLRNVTFGDSTVQVPNRPRQFIEREFDSVHRYPRTAAIETLHASWYTQSTVFVAVALKCYSDFRTWYRGRTMVKPRATRLQRLHAISVRTYYNLVPVTFVVWCMVAYKHGSTVENLVFIAAVLVSLIPCACRRMEVLPILVAICFFAWDVWDGIGHSLLQRAWARAGDWSVPFGGGTSSSRWPRASFRTRLSCDTLLDGIHV